MDLTYVTPKGNAIRLNPRLVEKQGLTEEDVAKIKKLWAVRDAIDQEAYPLLRAWMSDRSPIARKRLKALAKEYEQTEFALQAAWKFPQDKNFHRWFDFAGCACPKMDNEDWYGTDRRIHTGNCPVHWPLNNNEDIDNT